MTDPHTAQQAARDEKLRRQCDEAVRALDAMLDDPAVRFGLDSREVHALAVVQRPAGARAESLFYSAGPPPPHVLAAVRWEWYTPSKSKFLSPDEREHVDKGGLLIRELTDEGRTALAHFHAFPRSQR